MMLEHPELAEQIRGTDVDPFYDNKKINSCLVWLYGNTDPDIAGFYRRMSWRLLTEEKKGSERVA